MDSFFPDNLFDSDGFTAGLDGRAFFLGAALRARATGSIACFSESGFLRREDMIAASFLARSSEMTINLGRAGGVVLFVGANKS